MTDAEQSAMIEVERNALGAMLVLFASAREIEAVAASDARLMAAADAITRIAETLDQVSDQVLRKLSSVNITSEGGLSALIAARLSQVGFALPLYGDASEFFAPIEATVDKVLKGARLHMH
ncbi:hypothetical protein [Bradyrhizobium sp. th.b2]|uniref:hypothetical protein n=1 Tax=Bradyrhizobium sp. th-b2 TaxID=172088 RepID=UPI00041D420D|nr:hypothetical protein [Bradyrhizobium sp. th.b2]